MESLKRHGSVWVTVIKDKWYYADFQETPLYVSISPDLVATVKYILISTFSLTILTVPKLLKIGKKSQRQ